MKPARRTKAVVIVGLTVLVALVVLIDRGGVIAWATAILGVVLLAKIWRAPSSVDLTLGVALAGVASIAWVATVAYVISTWESGEVVELSIDTREGLHSARVWVLDVGADPVIYYDADPEVASALLAGTPLALTRDGVVSTRVPVAASVDTLTESRTDELFEAMAGKYGPQMGAATVWYALLGRPRDRVAVVATLERP